MTSSREDIDVIDVTESLRETEVGKQDDKDVSLHKRRRGEPPASLAVRPQPAISDEGSSPCTAGLTPDDDWPVPENVCQEPTSLCESMLKRLKDREDPLSKRGKELAATTLDTIEALDQLEKLFELLDQFLQLKEQNLNFLTRLKDINQLKRMHRAYKQIDIETEKLKEECKDVQLINEALDALELDSEYSYGEALLDNMLSGGRGMKRSGSKWKGHSRFGGSLLRKQRSRSAGGDDSDASPASPLRRRSEGIASKEVEKSKVSKWTRVKAAFRWEKAQWGVAAVGGMGGAAGAVAAGALVGAVALAGSAPAAGHSPSADLPKDSASLTPVSAISLTPNSSCEELRMDAGNCRKSGILRCDENDNTFLQAPAHDDSSTSPSPNKLHKSPWGKMRDIIQTRRESVRKKQGRGAKTSPDVVPPRRRSFSDGGDSDAPPALTLTIPSSEELVHYYRDRKMSNSCMSINYTNTAAAIANSCCAFLKECEEIKINESEPYHPLLRKQRSLELSGGRPPPHRPPRPSKWSKVKRAFLTSASASVPSSPSRHSAFFTDVETEGVSSGCEANAVREEIARDYAVLQSRLRREFSDRRGKLYAGSRPVATEEQLSADFRKKLAEWQRMKGSAARQPPPAPARQDLSEDFLKKWDEWKRMKETNSVPAWEEEAKPDEVLVQTSTGLFKFHGISRSFTRKLHEWEKSRGIAPEASTSALLRAARARGSKAPPVPSRQLTRTQSVGSVAPSAAGSGRLHASSLSVNDADDFDLEFERDNQSMERGEDVCDGESTRGAVLVEVEAEEVCTAAPLMAVSPRHTAQKPVYTYGNAEARLLCETNAAVTGTAILQPNVNETRLTKGNVKGCSKLITASREQSRPTEKPSRRKVTRQPSIEEDAMFIRKTIEEIERGSTSWNNDKEAYSDHQGNSVKHTQRTDQEMPSTSKIKFEDKKSSKQEGFTKHKESNDELVCGVKDDKKKDVDKGNGKKKSKSRARLEREQSKPSESDTEQDVDTVTVEIPKRRKRPRRASERPRTPPASALSDSEGEIFVLKLQAPELRHGSPEVIVKTTRKIFSPVVRNGESVPRAVIPVDVDDLQDVRPSIADYSLREENTTGMDNNKRGRSKNESARITGSGELCETEEQRPRTRPPLPSSPSAQRRPQPKETAPSIRIMIQRYNMKINEEGHTSGASSGASSPAWRSPAAERRRPPDMPVGVNIRNNPFLEREVQKSASACQLSRRDQSSCEQRPPTPPPGTLEGVLKSHSACAVLSVDKNQCKVHKTSPIPLVEEPKTEVTQDVIKCSPSTDTIVPSFSRNLPDLTQHVSLTEPAVPAVFKKTSYSQIPSVSKFVATPSEYYARSLSATESPKDTLETDTVATRTSDRAQRIRAARERFLSSPGPLRRDGTGSASELRPGDRSSRVSCESDVTEGSREEGEDAALGRSASTGMVNVDRDAWDRLADDGRRPRASRNRFSLARLAARLRRRDESAVTRLCRQSLLVQLKNKN